MLEGFSVSPRMFAWVAGLLAALVGVIVLSLPVSASVSYGALTLAGSDCGNGWTGTPDRYSGSLAARCDAAMGSRQAIGYGLLGVGVLVAAGALLIRPQRPAGAVTPQH